jgi:hypothetical protein
MPAAQLRDLFERLVPPGVARRPREGTFDEMLAGSAEDLELRRKLAGGDRRIAS